jgi:predicted RNA-binding Zn ribbon-like protein
VGGALALDFVNTASQRVEGPFKEKLHGYFDLVRFAADAGAIAGPTLLVLEHMATADPGAADRVVADARALREAIYRVFSARAGGAPVDPADLQLISRGNAEAVAHRRLSSAPEGFRFTWPDPPESLDQVLWPIAADAAELLVSEELTRVKECATDNCNWLFLDASKNRSRRWCEMKECGNRAKARRHYAKKRTT